MNTTIPSRLSDRELEAEVSRLAGCEREATASLIAHLAELYGRRLHERAGFSSLFTYCTDVLRLSEHEAYDRMKAAKVVRRYPAVLTLLVSGRVNLTTVRLLAPHLTRKNEEELFSAASGKSKRQVQELLAGRYPKADVASSVRKLPSSTVATPPTRMAAWPGAASVESQSIAESDAGAMALTSATATSTGETAPCARIPEPPRPVVQPLSPDRYRVTFTANAEMCEKLALCKKLGGDVNGTDKNGETVIHAAAYKEVPSVAQFLLDKGAKIDVWNTKNTTGWSVSCAPWNVRGGSTAPSNSCPILWRCGRGPRTASI